jgi:hypothetical protein
MRPNPLVPVAPVVAGAAEPLAVRAAATLTSTKAAMIAIPDLQDLISDSSHCFTF